MDADVDCLNRLRTVGFVKLALRLDTAIVDSLVAVCDELLSSAGPGHKRDYMRVSANEPVARVEYLFEKHPVFLHLAAHPSLVAFARVALGADPIVTWEDLFIKQFGCSLEVPFHQDSLFQSRRSPVYRFGIYLDASSRSPLRVIPGTHTLGALHARQIHEIVSAAPDSIESLCMGPGEILVHDTMLFHASDAHPDAPPRRVVYLEYRTHAQLAYDSPWDSAWIARRHRLLSAGRSLRHRYPDVGELREGWACVPEDIRCFAADALRVDHEDQAYPDFHLRDGAVWMNESRQSA